MDSIFVVWIGQTLRARTLTIRHNDAAIWRQGNQSGRPQVVALFSATYFSSYFIELLQLQDAFQIIYYILHQTYEYHFSHAAG